MQLAGDAPTIELRRHYLKMAEAWAAQAERGPDADADGAETPGEDPDTAL